MKKIDEIESRLVNVEMWMRNDRGCRHVITIEFLRDNIRGIEKALQNTMKTQDLLVAALVEAGILVEKSKESKQYLEIDNKQYTIRKVK